MCDCVKVFCTCAIVSRLLCVCDGEGGEEAKAESSVRRRLVGVREEEDVDVLLVLDMVGCCRGYFRSV